MFERFAATARDAVFHAIGQAGARGDRRVGTDHLLIGVASTPAVADILGVEADAARHAADELDRRAIAAIGLDAGAHWPCGPAVGAARLPFTPAAKKVLRKALAYTVAERERRITTRHLLLALLERGQPDPAAAVLAELKVDRRRLRERLQPLP